MTTEKLLTLADLAERWQCGMGKLRNARPQDLPPRFKPPRTRLVRFRLADVIAFEEEHIVHPIPDTTVWRSKLLRQHKR